MRRTRGPASRYPPRVTRVLLLSTYELGHQPIGLAAPAAALRLAGHEVTCRDLSVDGVDLETVRAAQLIAISAPMHTAARLGTRVAERVRAVVPSTHLAWYGLYAHPLAELLTRRGLADSVLGGEYEDELVALAGRLDAGATEGIVGAWFPRRDYAVPDRTGLPSLERYASVLRADGPHLVGYVETTRGCAHVCRHCPLTAVYGGRLRLVQADAVLGDIEQQVAAGAAHITFGDPDFLNAAEHAMTIARTLHERHPGVTFDVTTKVEHLLEHEALLPELRALGCIFVTSAFESCSDVVLERLDKGHTSEDLGRALDVAEAAGLLVRPTWVAFTPWGTLDDFIAMLEFIERRGIVRHVQPVQYALRLLLPPGSPLIELLASEGRLGAFDDAHLTYEWAHEDPRMDALQAELGRIVEEDARHDDDGAMPDPLDVFGRVKAAALAARAGTEATATVEVAAQPARHVPGLSEAWFCCAEPTSEQLAPLDIAMTV